MNAESQLNALEAEIKALKASYPIAASKAKFYVQTSQEFTVSGTPSARFKFRPNYGLGKVSFTRLRASVMIGDAPVGFSPQATESQDGSGEVILSLRFEPYSASTVYKVRIIASGTSPGSFSML